MDVGVVGGENKERVVGIFKNEEQPFGNSQNIAENLSDSKLPWSSTYIYLYPTCPFFCIILKQVLALSRLL
jgi:hypothetical protein